MNQKFAIAEKIASPQFQAHLRAANAGGKDVYISMNTVTREATAEGGYRTIRHIYLDIDVGGRAAVDKILNADGMPNPHHVLNTSLDKYQVIWSVEGFEKQGRKTRYEEWLRSMEPIQR
ncbi:MAG: DNA-primase RepB domain-containing protein [Bryobacteraceae bacterium]